jgi:large subunit ribosomal protein L23
MIIKGFIISEKTTDLVEDSQYSFWVDVNANKNQIKQAVKDRFNVEVISVKTINQKGKKKSWQRQTGRKKDRKKAIVKLKKGQKIKDFEISSNE